MGAMGVRVTVSQELDTNESRHKYDYICRLICHLGIYVLQLRKQIELDLIIVPIVQSQQALTASLH